MVTTNLNEEFIEIMTFFNFSSWHTIPSIQIICHKLSVKYNFAWKESSLNSFVRWRLWLKWIFWLAISEPRDGEGVDSWPQFSAKFHRFFFLLLLLSSLWIALFLFHYRFQSFSRLDIPKTCIPFKRYFIPIYLKWQECNR